MDQPSAFRTFLDKLRLRTRGYDDHRDAAPQAEVDARAAAVLAGVTDPVLHAVLDLHRPVVESLSPWPLCLGCDSSDGPDAEPPEWPCKTWTLIQQMLAR